MDDWPGIRFCPTEDEMISRNLCCKLMGTMLPVNEFINEISIYNFDPWELRFQSKIKSRDPVWYFFVKNHGDRQNRTTKSGFWKITGKPVPINDRWGDWSDAIGFKRHLRFHYGKNTNEGKGDWFIDEYHNNMLSQNLRTHVMCRVRYTGNNKHMISDIATEPSFAFVSRLTNGGCSAVDQSVQGNWESTNNLSEYDSGNQMDQSVEGSSGHLSDYNPANQIQHFSTNFNTQEQAPYFASIDNEIPMLPDNVLEEIFDYLYNSGEQNLYTSMRENCNEHRPKDPVTRVFDDYSSDSENESTLFGDTSSSEDSVGNPNELCSTPIPPLNSTDQIPTSTSELQTTYGSSEEVKMELQDKEKVISELECKMVEDSCIKKTPATKRSKQSWSAVEDEKIGKKTHRTPKWIYLRTIIFAVFLLFSIIASITLLR